MMYTERNPAQALFKAFLHLLSVHSAVHPLAVMPRRAVGGTAMWQKLAAEVPRCSTSSVSLCCSSPYKTPLLIGLLVICQAS